MSAVFFDLDGTLVDPAGGITGGIARALESQGITVPDAAALDSLVGPPLALGLREIVGVPEDRLEAVIEEYRAWYAQAGIAASRTYPGVEEALGLLARAGLPLAVTTSKPQTVAESLLGHHGLLSRFTVVRGSSDTEVGGPQDHASKEPQVRAAARDLDVDPATVAVVGDRHYDIEAAIATAAAPVGVGWGFAAPGELERAGADVVLREPGQLPGLFVKTETYPRRASKETA